MQQIEREHDEHIEAKEQWISINREEKKEKKSFFVGFFGISKETMK